MVERGALDDLGITRPGDDEPRAEPPEPDVEHEEDDL